MFWTQASDSTKPNILMITHDTCYRDVWVEEMFESFIRFYFFFFFSLVFPILWSGIMELANVNYCELMRWQFWASHLLPLISWGFCYVNRRWNPKVCDLTRLKVFISYHDQHHGRTSPTAAIPRPHHCTDLWWASTNILWFSSTAAMRAFQTDSYQWELIKDLPYGESMKHF